MTNPHLPSPRASGRTLVANDDEPIDLLTWRKTGRDVGAVEAVLQANPGLARTAAALPDQTQVFLPDSAAAPKPLADLVQFWG